MAEAEASRSALKRAFVPWPSAYPAPRGLPPPSVETVHVAGLFALEIMRTALLLRSAT